MQYYNLWCHKVGLLGWVKQTQDIDFYKELLTFAAQLSDGSLAVQYSSWNNVRNSKWTATIIDTWTWKYSPKTRRPTCHLIPRSGTIAADVNLQRNIFRPWLLFHDRLTDKTLHTETLHNPQTLPPILLSSSPSFSSSWNAWNNACGTPAEKVLIIIYHLYSKPLEAWHVFDWPIWALRTHYYTGFIHEDHVHNTLNQQYELRLA